MQPQDQPELPLLHKDSLPLLQEGSAVRQQSEVEGQPAQIGPNSELRKKFIPNDASYYQYRLKGVVVHQGTAQYGHYISYINIQEEDNKWLEFNDSLIKDFNASQIEAECFGGSSDQSKNDDWVWQVRGEQSKNAYILIYERKHKDPIKIVYQDPSEKQELIHDLCLQEVAPQEKAAQSDEKSFLVDYYKMTRYIPKKLYKPVWMDNHAFMLENHMYNDDYLTFVADICKTIKLPEDYTCIQATEGVCSHDYYRGYETLGKAEEESYMWALDTLYKHYYDVAIHCFDTETTKTLMLPLLNFLHVVPGRVLEFFQKYIVADKKNVLNILISCPEKNVRVSLKIIIAACISIMLKYDSSHARNGEMQPAEQNMLKEASAESEVFSFMDGIIDQLNTEIAKNWTKAGDVIELIRMVVVNSEQGTAWAFKKQLVSVLIDFYLEKQSPLGNQLGEKKNLMGNQYSRPEFAPLIQTVVFLSLKDKRMQLSEQASHMEDGVNVKLEPCPYKLS